MENIFLAGFAFTTQFDFQPRTNPARLFTLSLSFWAMLTAAAYTANLASFLVVRKKPTHLKSVAEAVRIGARICVHNSTETDEELTRSYDTDAKAVRKDTEQDTFLGVLKGHCDVAFTTVSTLQYWERHAEINGNCELDWIGRTFRVGQAGFATVSDAGTLCTSLIRDVLHIHFLRMKEDGFIDKAWEENLERIANKNCRSAADGGADSGQLNLKSMGGIFVLHYGVSIVAIICALIFKWLGMTAKRDKRMKEKVVQRQVSKLESTRRLMISIKKDRASRGIVNVKGIDHLGLTLAGLDCIEESSNEAEGIGMDGTIHSGNDVWSDADEDDPMVLMGESFDGLSLKQEINEMKQQMSALMKMMMDDRKSATKSNGL